LFPISGNLKKVKSFSALETKDDPKLSSTAKELLGNFEKSQVQNISIAQRFSAQDNLSIEF
jgi:hypothetical protein